MIKEFLSIAGSVVKDQIHRKADYKDKLRYDIYQKRFAIYEEIIATLSSMTSTQNLPMNISARNLSHKISEYTHELKTFINRLPLPDSDDAAKILFLFIKEIQREAEDRPENVSEAAYAASLRAVFCNRVDNVIIEFREFRKKENKAVLFN